MTLVQNLEKIEMFRLQIESYGNLPADVLKQINYKFRLDWNYYSNSMEGNTLTEAETRSVMINNITVSGKPIKDVLEMQGHDQVITEILKIGKSQTRLSEKRIKEIHKAIMREDDPDKQKEIGVWKKGGNYLYNYKNERFDFLPPSEVPEAMHQVLNWVNAELDKVQASKVPSIDAVLLAFEFHIRYIAIHPFYDGNGRTARILMNLILISLGYPPVIIKKEEENLYKQYLADIQADGGSPDLFYELMTSLLIRSQELMLKAIQGEAIDEEEDWKKELKLIKQNIGKNKVKAKKSIESVAEALESFILTFNRKRGIKLKELEESFQKANIFIENKTVLNFNNKVSFGYENTYQFIERNKASRNILISYQLDGFKSNSSNIFNINVDLILMFDDYSYSVKLTEGSKRIEKLYGDSFTDQEMDTIINEVAKSVVAQIKSRVGEQ